MKKETSQHLNVIRIVGMAIAWTVMLIPTSFQYFSFDYDSGRFDITTTLFCLGGTAASFAVVNLLRRGFDVPFSLLMVGGALFAVGNSVTYASTVAYLLPGYLAYPFVALQGAGTALFILSWVQLSSSLFPATFAKDIATSMVGGALLLAIIAMLRNSPRLAWLWPFVAVAIMIVSLSCSFAVIRRKDTKPSELSIQGKVTNPYFVPLSIGLSLSVVGFVVLFSHAGVSNPQNSLAAAEGLIFAIIVLIAFLAFAHTQISKREPVWMVKLSFLVLIVGIMANFASPHIFALVSRALIFSGSICAFFNLLIMLKVVSDRQSVSRSYAFALGFSFFYFGGTLAETCLVISTSAQEEAVDELHLAMGILFSLIIVALFVDAAFFLDGKP
ncbi:MAG: hypothetical protein LBK67_04760, partial [Coriobacteriales bacterium]|nr:hypothetical protein [Coriobacteriales bacterium]